MAKVFRLHNGNNNITHWQGSQAYGNNAINEIKDPEGGVATKEITSIPSPLARIDLVKNAFKIISDQENLDGDTIYHKTVSESLDIGEIFFNLDKLKDKIEIIEWDKNKNLEALLNSKNEAHKLLGDTLNKFFKGDAKAYNFDKLKNLYLLNYIGDGREKDINIIGATSPCTMFFSSANNLNFISNHITFATNKPFDTNYLPLYKRDKEYIKYLFAFQRSLKEFSSLFKELYSYLKLTYGKLDNELKAEIDKMSEFTSSEYPEHKINTTTEVEILGQILHKRKTIENFDSQFEIDSKIYPGKKPLVLPAPYKNTETTGRYEKLIYTCSTWNKDFKAPYIDNTYWENRILPHLGDKYPYLSISDFLEDTLISSPYKLNKDCFHDAFSVTDKDISYLLPLKELIFEFFTIEEIIEKKMIELKPLAGGSVLVTLQIPIKGVSNIKYVEYQRAYYYSDAEINENKGSIIDVRFGLGFFPLLRIEESDKHHYRIALLDKAKEVLKLSFYDGKKEVSIKERVLRRKKDNDNSVETYIVENSFDRLSISYGTNIKGTVFPIMKNAGGSSSFTFAIDFGTTNTHIEYVKNSEKPIPFEISESDKQFRTLHEDYRLDRSDFEHAFLNNFIPKKIGVSGEHINFPIRTALSENLDVDYKKYVYCLANTNIPFNFEKGVTPQYNNIETNLKWSPDNQQRIRLYIENLLYMIRNKVLLNGGSLKQTKIVWFYPASMSYAQWEKFKLIWEEAYSKYFSKEDIENNLIATSESIAPYKYYNDTLGAKSNVVTIDIGGGTTDVYVVEDSDPKMLLSFKFASNSIFGDGYNWNSDNNGFVNTFKNEILETLKANRFIELEHTLKEIANRKNSNDINALFFSLNKSKDIKDNILSLDYLNMLSNDDYLKYVFIFFYSSILYYVAKCMKAKGLEMPLTIAFSGNGSKSLQILSNNNKTQVKFMKMIFEKVYNEKYQETNDLEIIYEANPKEATCKGGVIKPKADDPDVCENIKCALLGVDMDTTFVSRQDMDTIDNTMLESVVNENIKFIDFVFELNDENNSFFINRFGANGTIINNIRNIAKMNLSDYAKTGLQNQKDITKNWGGENKIEETMFFYPLVGMLNNMAREIYKLRG